MGVTIEVELDTKMVDWLIKENPPGEVSRIVADGVHYGFWQEVGVENGFGRGIRIPAHPFMTPAVEAVRPGFEKAFKGILLTVASVEAVVVKVANNVMRLARVHAPFDTGALRGSIHVE